MGKSRRRKNKSKGGTSGEGGRLLEGGNAASRPSEIRQRHIAMATLGSDNIASPTDSVIKISPPAIRPEDDEKETFMSIFFQVVAPLFVAGVAMVGAGIYLDTVQHWKVFEEVLEIIILVPALLGLKGNLEMTLASRLSTEANLGKMNDPKEQWNMIFGNLCLVQCQAVVIGLLSSVVAILLVVVFHHKINISHAIMVCACSITTASIASFLLGLVTVGIVVGSMYFKINPDNVTTPIAASLGDITSLVLLSYIATGFYHTLDEYLWVPVIVIIGFLVLMPVWVYITANNNYTKHVLTTGWSPIISAMLISTVGGLALGHFIKEYKTLTAFQPVINGIGGNLVSIQASRLSTALHKYVSLGELPEGTKILISPIKVFTSKGLHALTSRVLISLVVPGHVVFAFVITYLQTGNFSPGSLFLSLYLGAALLQVTILLFLAYILTHYFWKQGVDPDNTTIPYLTACGDLLGIILLGLVYKFLELIGGKENQAL
ncbi:solute carrier family 41 member 2 isoform X2 [Cimex lectularius]|uniref:SLC41A/MgtE integral membrane domain-containing protein n=1 Tax=Cimex lectularius TaxID=79782 RepID=A0A8I6RGB7_CIMLE|nr:solute carrier family 41 member 2 isoform X2 [Cimex lectularius]